MNSIHHQAVKDLAPGFFVEAYSVPDCIVEAIRWRGPGYVAGVQWHPEFHDPGDARLMDGRVILDDFLGAARAAAAPSPRF